MKNLTILALALINTATWAQGVSQKSAKLAYSHSIALSQSFYWNGGLISEISIPVFSRYQPTSHPATIYVVSGSGSSPFNGNILFQQDVSFSSLNKFYPESLLSTLSVAQMENLWVDIQNLIDNDSLLFDDLKTTFSINQYFPMDSMTLVVELDTSVNYLGYKYLTAFGNCFSNGNCPLPIPDPYEDGVLYFGYSASVISTDSDLSFEILGTSTGLYPLEYENVKVFPNPSNGEFYLSFDGTEIEYEIFDQIGSLVQKGVVEDKRSIRINNSAGVYLLRTSFGSSVRLVVL